MKISCVKQRIYIIGLLFLISSAIFSQQFFVRNIDFALKITDDSTLLPIRNPKVISYSTLESFNCDSSGYLHIELPQTDSIRIAAMGYFPRTIKVSVLSQTYINHYSLEPYTYILPEVRIKPHGDSIKLSLHLPSDIKLGYKSDVPMRYRPIGIGPNASPLSMITNPIYALYSLTSSKEKSKNKVRELRQADLFKDHHDYILMDKDVIAEESGFTGDSLQIFIAKCNSSIRIKPEDTAYTVRHRIRSLASNFRNPPPNASLKKK